MNQRLPSFDYQYKIDWYSNFNNQLMAGKNAGLSLYDDENDLKLYKYIDTKQISTDKINFDDINKELDEKGKAFNQGKQTIKGLVDGINQTFENTKENLNDSLKNLFSISPEYKFYGIAILLFFILRK